uniref:Uncharacterized protein n=1 Tax=Arundo donax TaxID=35708 RepID=A0A0A9DI50_ARUDO
MLNRVCLFVCACVLDVIQNPGKEHLGSQRKKERGVEVEKEIQRKDIRKVKQLLKICRCLFSEQC